MSKRITREEAHRVFDPDAQGAAVWHGDPDDGKYKTGLDRIIDALDAPACPGCAKYARTIAEVRGVLRELLKKLD